MTPKNARINHKTALIMLGIAVSVAYMAPTMMALQYAHASGGGGNESGEASSKPGRGALNFSGYPKITDGRPSGFGSGAGGFLITDRVTAKECNECHQAYGADALPQGSWIRIMSTLANHFGEDASLDKQTRTHIETYLVSNAPSGDGPLRISDQRWFKNIHGREVSRRARQRSGTMGNCVSCHAQKALSPQQ